MSPVETLDDGLVHVVKEAFAYSAWDGTTRCDRTFRWNRTSDRGASTVAVAAPVSKWRVISCLVCIARGS